MRKKASDAVVWLLYCLSSVFVLVPTARAQNVLVDPTQMLATAKRIDFVGHNDFSVERTAQGSFLRSVPHRSASGLYKPVEMNGVDLTHISWRWRVDRLHETADVRRLEAEDFGAMVMFVFGHPSLLNRDVPTLGYVWTSTPVQNETLLRSQRYGSLAYIQLRGATDVGRLMGETRDVAADFRAAFGKKPGALKYIAVFNDNDQTNEPASAVFGPILDLRRYSSEP